MVASFSSDVIIHPANYTVSGFFLLLEVSGAVVLRSVLCIDLWFKCSPGDFQVLGVPTISASPFP